MGGGGGGGGDGDPESAEGEGLGEALVDSDRAGQEAAPPITTEPGPLSTDPFDGFLFQAGFLPPPPPALPPQLSPLSGGFSAREISAGAPMDSDSGPRTICVHGDDATGPGRPEGEAALGERVTAAAAALEEGGLLLIGDDSIDQIQSKTSFPN